MEYPTTPAKNKTARSAWLRCVLGITTGCLLSGCGASAWLMEWRPGKAPEPAVVAAASDLELSRRAFSRGNYGIAISHLQSELARHPASIAALNGLGASYDKLGRYDVAQRYYFRALDLAPRSALTLNNMGYSYFLQGRHEEAARYLELAGQYAGSRPNDMYQVAAVALLAAVEAEEAVLPADATAAAPRETAALARADIGTSGHIDAGAVAPGAVAGVAQAAIAVEAATLPLSAQVLPLARLDASARIEVSNGNGVNGMAARYRGLLQQQGGQVVRLTNADNYAYTRSAVYFRQGHRAAAAALVAGLPLHGITLIETADLVERVDVRLLIGKDMLGVTTQDFPGVSLAQNLR